MVRFGQWIGTSLLAAVIPVAGCAHHRACTTDCDGAACDTVDCDGKAGKKFRKGKCRSCGHACSGTLCVGCRSLAIPEGYPLGSVVRAHYHQMQTNAEAADFILHDHEFVGQSAELTPDGKDHVLEIAARMRSAPFPVIIERIENNADPELDAHRRTIVAQILTDLGNPDAPQRVIVAPAYGPGKQSSEAQLEYWQHTYSGYNNFSQFGAWGGLGQGSFGGGFGFGGFGGVGFGP